MLFEQASHRFRKERIAEYERFGHGHLSLTPMNFQKSLWAV